MPSSGEPEPAHWPRAILHLDMDAFYVNVHVQDHPEDRGIPLVVGGQPQQRGVVSSASYEARQFGIHSAMPTSRALQMVRQLKIVSPNWPRIKERSQQVMRILEKYGPLEPMSVDEAYVDLNDYEDPVAVALIIKADVKETTSLPCSIGLATSKLVAKIASDHDKPDGFTIVFPGKEAAFLAPKPTHAIIGIGPQTAKRLAGIGIHTCGQLAAADAQTIEQTLGRHGIAFIARAQGADKRTVHAEPRQAKSISQEWTFSQDINDAQALERQIKTMCASVAKTLHKRQLVAHTITVKIRWPDFTTFTRQKSFANGIDSEQEIYQLAKSIFYENWNPGQFIRLLGVGVSNLEYPQVRQLRLALDAK